MSEIPEKKRKYLIDTSALYPMLLEGVYMDSDRFAITTLTEYEIGNVLWKESKNKKLKNPNKISQIFADAIKDLKRYNIDRISEVLDISIGRGLNFYDASYAYVAETQNLILITEDTELLKKTKNAIRVQEIKL
jgi:predicted nucleic acid-binding protein